MPTTLSLVLISLAGFVHAASAQTVEGAVAPKDQPLFETILAIETKIPGTLKKNYIKAFAGLVAGDLLAIDEEAFHGKADVVKAMEEQKSKGILFTDFDMQNIRFIRLGANAAILAYREIIRGTDNGAPFVWHVNTHSIYERRAGKWVFRFFQDTMAK